MHELIAQTNPQWHEILSAAMDSLDSTYIDQLNVGADWLPGPHGIFAAFRQPLSEVKYVLLGESPYPRAASANGFAFWDNAVNEIWSTKGLSTAVNRATSLRNLMKMLLVARGDLQEDCSQAAIAALDKSPYWQTADEFFNAMIRKGFLLLNASLVFRKGMVNEDARQWRPFLSSVLEALLLQRPEVAFILFGKIASQMDVQSLSTSHGFKGLIAEHPYNLSFITNPNVLQFFKPLHLLDRHE